MKNICLLLVFVLSGLVVTGQAPSANRLNQLSRAEAKQALRAANFVEKAAYSGYNLVYQRMEWEINPEVKFIKGNVTSYIVAKNSILDSVRFDLSRTLTVDSVKNRLEALNYRHNNDALDIALSKPLASDGIDSVTVYYHGIPEDNGFGSFVQGQHNSIPIIWTLSEPYGALDWWPCKQSLSDKIDSIDVIVTCPEAYRTAGNGILVSETVRNGKRTMHWKHRHPIATYLVGIAVTNYASYSDTLKTDDGKDINILNFVYPENLEEAKQQTKEIVEIMNLYDHLFGTYPFADEKYGHAQFGWGGGMEHQTMSFVAGFGFDLIAHELAHQWFGDYVTLASWHDIWLNEGFATFVTGLAYENLLGGVWWPVWRKQLVASITSVPDGSVYVEDTTNINRIFNSRLSYYKGAYLLHMLRWELGDDHFFKAINNYLYDPEEANGFATQNNLVSHLEQEADTSLTEFFNEWYYGEGYPVYSLKYSQDPEMILKLSLSQTTTSPKVNFFKMPVPIRCYNSDKTDSMDFRLENTYNDQEFIVDPGFRVSQVKIDPDLWLISKTDTITHAPWVNNLKKILIYPNPVRNFITVVPPRNEEIKNIRVFSIKGKLMRNVNGSRQRINLSALPTGSYIIQTSTIEGSYIHKIVKQ